MKNHAKVAGLAVLVVSALALGGLSGCEKKPEATKPATPPVKAPEAPK